jgi:hypothetical protein
VWRWTLVAIVILLVTFALLDAAAQPPPPLAASAPGTQFSADRAQERLARLIGDSTGHPASTAPNAVVRQRVMDEIAALGLPVETQTAFSCQPRWAVCAEVTNVMTRWPGTGGGPAVLLTAHYDSVAAGPGAGDDMSGVATLLEVARALREGPPMVSPVILLFTDGEEVALLGAQAFVDEHPWAQDVGVVVNLEANGTSGQSILFETTHHSEWLAQTLGGAVPQLAGNAFADSLYTLFPFNTDLTIYEAAGIPGVNFAFVERHAQYHTPLDIPANIDPGSLQHHGDNALAAARAFGSRDLRDLPEGEAVYADLAPGWFVSWPQAWTLGLALMLGAGWVAVTALALRRGQVRLRQVLWGMVLHPVAVVLATLVGLALGILVQVSSGTPVPWYANPWPLRVLLWASALLTVISVASLLSRRAGMAGLFYGVWLAWVLPGVVVAAAWPPASVMVFAPVLLALIPALLLQVPAMRDWPWALPAATALGLVGAGWTWLWFARGSDYTVLTPEYPATAAFAIALSASAGAALLGVAAGARRVAAALVGGYALLAVAALGTGWLVPVYSATSPQPLNVQRIEDVQADRVLWALDAEGAVPGPMLATRPFAEEPAQAVPWQNRQVYVAPDGEGISLDGPARSVSRPIGEPLRLVLPSAPPGSHVAVHVPQEAGVQGFRLLRGNDARDLAAPPLDDGYSRFLCIAPACDDATLEITLERDESFQAFITQTTFGLPGTDQDILASRPVTATPRHNGDTTMVVERIAVGMEQKTE